VLGCQIHSGCHKAIAMPETAAILVPMLKTTKRTSRVKKVDGDLGRRGAISVTNV